MVWATVPESKETTFSERLDLDQFKLLTGLASTAIGTGTCIYLVDCIIDEVFVV